MIYQAKDEDWAVALMLHLETVIDEDKSFLQNIWVRLLIEFPLNKAKIIQIYSINK